MGDFRRVASVALVAALAAGPVLGSPGARRLSYEILREYVRLDVQPNATVFLFYNLTVRVDSGSISRFVRVGMPKGGFEVLYAYEAWPEGLREVDFSEIEEGGYYAVEIHPSEPIEAGQSRTFLIEAAVPDFVYEDETNPGNVGLKFTPSWFEDAPIRDLRLSIVLPAGVGRDEVLNQPDYDGAGTTDGRLYLYWEREDLNPGENITVGVSFPAEYMQRYARPPGGELEPAEVALGLAFLAVVLLAVGALAYSGYKAIKSAGWGEYEEPWFGIEALGAQKRLLPAEVVYLSELERPGRPDYGRLFSAIIVPMAMRGELRVLGIDPLRLEKGEERPRRYYEKLLLKCVRPGDGLDVPCAARVVKAIHRRVEDKMAGFSRGETLRFYREKIAKIWREIGESPQEERARLVEQNIDWLVVDKRFRAHLRRAMRPESEEGGYVLVPRGSWWWFDVPPPPPSAPIQGPSVRTVGASGAGREGGTGGETAGPGTPEPVGSVERGAGQVVVGIERAADGIATSIERFSSSVSQAVEGVADRVASLIIPRSRIRSTRRARASASSCVCACVSCACACACVSCACACAGGGAG